MSSGLYILTISLLPLTALIVFAMKTDVVWSNVFACAIAIVLTPLLMPWKYLWRNYGIAPMEPFHG